MEMFRDLLGLIFIWAHLMFSCSFESRRLVHAAVMVSVVMSSMYAWIGGSQSPFLVRSPPTTHLEALMMTSMAIDKAWGEIVQPAYVQTLPHGSEIRCCETQLRVLEVRFYQCSDEFWHMGKAEGFPKKFVGDWAKGVGQVEKDDMEVSFVLLSCLDLVSNHAVCSWQPEDPGMPAFCADVLICLFLSK